MAKEPRVKQEKQDGVVDAESLAFGAIDGDADGLLDRILRNALGTDDPKDSVKKEGVKKEGVKNEKGIKQEQLALEGVKGEGVKGEGVKGEGVKGEGVKGEHRVKLEAPALPPIDGRRGRSRGRKKRSRSGKKKRSRSRGRKRSRSRKRRRRSSSSESRSKSVSPVAAALEGLPQARVVAVRGHWAQYLSPAGETFYKNVLSGEVQWQKPTNFDCVPSRRAGEMTPGPGEAACYIFHMPPEWSEADLMQLFSPFGQVTSAHVQRDANGFSRSCGFVTYATQDGAAQACSMMNGFGVDGKFLKVSLTQFSLGAGGPVGGAPGGPAAPSGVPQAGIAPPPGGGMQTGGIPSPAPRPTMGIPGL
mmetsp:Transcript_23964/g.44461  ORF Transcript_23964/g.44461 Transcript_23964/m.44461 type:complete len:361 (+) Transcript_23964:49-1131(+)